MTLLRAIIALITVVTVVGGQKSEPEIIAEANLLIKEASVASAHDRVIILKKVISMVPNKLEPVFNLGLAAREAGDLETALKAFQEVAMRVNKNTKQGLMIFKSASTMMSEVILEHPTRSGDSSQLSRIADLLSSVAADTAIHSILTKVYFRLGDRMQSRHHLNKIIDILDTCGGFTDDEVHFISLFLNQDLTELNAFAHDATVSPDKKTLFGFHVLGAGYTDVAVSFFTRAVLEESLPKPHLGSAGYQVVQNSKNESLNNLVTERLLEMKIWSHPQQRIAYSVDVLSEPFPGEGVADSIKEILTLIQHKDEIIAEWKTNFDNINFSVRDENSRLSTGWKEYAYAVGGRLSENSDAFVSRFPRTAELLSKFELIPKGFIGFSSLQPGSSIDPHCGSSNHKLRLHFGVSVPGDCQPDAGSGLEKRVCGIKVGNDTRGWPSGGVLVIDDSFLHSVWNKGPSVRVVLIVDVWHPSLTLQQRKQVAKDFGFSSPQ